MSEDLNFKLEEWNIRWFQQFWTIRWPKL